MLKIKLRKGEIATFLTLGLVVVGAVITLVSSLVVKNNKIAINSKAAFSCSSGSARYGSVNCMPEQICGGYGYYISGTQAVEGSVREVCCTSGAPAANPSSCILSGVNGPIPTITDNPNAPSCIAGAYFALSDCEVNCGINNCRSCKVNTQIKYECKVSSNPNLKPCVKARTYASEANCKLENPNSVCTQCKVDITVRYEAGGTGPTQAPLVSIKQPGENCGYLDSCISGYKCVKKTTSPSMAEHAGGTCQKNVVVAETCINYSTSTNCSSLCKGQNGNTFSCKSTPGTTDGKWCCPTGQTPPSSGSTSTDDSPGTGCIDAMNVSNCNSLCGKNNYSFNGTTYNTGGYTCVKGRSTLIKKWCCPGAENSGTVIEGGGTSAGGTQGTGDICKDMYGSAAYCPTSSGTGVCFLTSDVKTTTKCRNGSSSNLDKYCCVPASGSSLIDKCFYSFTGSYYSIGEQVCLNDSTYQVCQNKNVLTILAGKTEWSKPINCPNCYNKTKGSVTCNENKINSCIYNKVTYGVNEQRCDSDSSYVQCLSTGQWSSSVSCLSCKESGKSVTCEKESSIFCQDITKNSSSYCDKVGSCFDNFEFYKNSQGNYVGCQDGITHGKCCIPASSSDNNPQFDNNEVLELDEVNVNGEKLYSSFIPGLGVSYFSL